MELITVENVFGPYSQGSDYLHIHAFDLNSRDQSALGEPPALPADSFLVDYYNHGRRHGQSRGPQGVQGQGQGQRLGQSQGQGPEVEQGLEQEQGRHFRMLVDAGKKGQGKNIILPYLLQHGIDYIDQVVISHMHRDHYGGVIDLLAEPAITIGQIILAPIPDEVIATNQSGYATWKQLELQLDTLSQEGQLEVRRLGTEHVGSWIELGDEVRWQVVAVPNLLSVPANGINDLNLVFKIQFRHFGALFPGDCGQAQAEEILQSEQCEALRDVFLLKAAHHGKGKSLSPQLIDLCNARIVLMPSNPHVVHQNRAELMEHLFDYAANGAKVYRMDQYEGVDLYTDGYTVMSVAKTANFSEKMLYQLKTSP